MDREGISQELDLPIHWGNKELLDPGGIATHRRIQSLELDKAGGNHFADLCMRFIASDRNTEGKVVLFPLIASARYRRAASGF